MMRLKTMPATWPRWALGALLAATVLVVLGLLLAAGAIYGVSAWSSKSTVKATTQSSHL